MSPRPIQQRQLPGAGRRGSLIGRSVLTAHGRVAFEAGVRDMRVHQQVWMLEGTIDITLGVERHRLRQGDCLAMQLDRPTMFHNPTRHPARYAVVIASDTPSRR